MPDTNRKAKLTPPPFEPPPIYPCNLVMKGGVTSGVVYPGAVRVLATQYRFRRIGGTSAGAIAAALTAAAEYRRREGNTNAGFEALWAASGALGKRPRVGPARTQLEALFAPNHRTRALHRLMSAAVHVDPRVPKAVRLSLAALRSYPVAVSAVTAGVAGVAVGAAQAGRGGDRARASQVALAGTWVALAGLGRLGSQVVIGGHRALKRNNLGLSTGHERRARRNESPRFTDWLHEQIQLVAGLGDQAAPLTFGDLAPGAAHENRPVTPGDTRRERQQYGELSPADLDQYARATDLDIDLRLITTDLAAGRPLVLPFDASTTDAKGYYFRPDEWREYFPPDVLRHLILHSERAVTPGTSRPRKGPMKYYRLPPPEQLPIVVATRLSMSFPGLFSVVPLYTPGWLRAEADDPHADVAWSQRTGERKLQRGRARFQRVVFGDGGVTSNFPLTLFDDLVPAEPTFGLNLEYSRTGHAPYLVAPERLRAYGRPDRDAGLNWKPRLRQVATLPEYGVSLFEAARNWSDTSLIGLPGVAERIAHVVIDSGSGGTNLTMTGEQIDGLRGRGLEAGRLLVKRFADPYGGWNWQVHQGAHFLTLTADLERLVQEYARAYGPGKIFDPASLSRVPLQWTRGDPEGQAFFPGRHDWKAVTVDALLDLGRRPTTLRGYRRLRGKRGALRYRPLT